MQALEGHPGPVIAVSDWIEELPSLVGRFVPRRFTTLGTNGFGRSDTREALRHHFEVSGPWVAYAALSALAAEGALPRERVVQARRELQIDAAKLDPAIA